MARKFAKIKPNFWSSKKIRDASKNAKLLAMYLMTNEYFQMVGLYRLRSYFMAEDTGLSADEAKKALSELIDLQFCCYDESSEVIWVIDMAVSQVADKPNSKQLKGVENELVRLAEDEFPFVQDFLNKHASRFGLPASIDELCRSSY